MKATVVLAASGALLLPAAGAAVVLLAPAARPVAALGLIPQPVLGPAPQAQTLATNGWWPSGTWLSGGSGPVPPPPPPLPPMPAVQPASPAPIVLATPAALASPGPLTAPARLSATITPFGSTTLPPGPGELHLLCTGPRAPLAHYVVGRSASGWTVTRDDGGTAIDVTYVYALGPWSPHTRC